MYTSVYSYSLSSHPFPLSLLPSLPPFSLPFLLEVGSPLNQLVGLRDAVSSPSCVRGRATAENEFGAL